MPITIRLRSPGAVSTQRTSKPIACADLVADDHGASGCHGENHTMLIMSMVPTMFMAAIDSVLMWASIALKVVIPRGPCHLLGGHRQR
jgi:hypothetical protein